LTLLQVHEQTEIYTAEKVSYISQGSVATQLRCCGNVVYTFSAECAGEKI